jgi:hypothetical protein
MANKKSTKKKSTTTKRSTRKGATKKSTTRKSPTKKAPQQKWVQNVMSSSNAMDLESGVFKGSPQEVAASLKKSVMKSKRTKGTKFQSAMSMLNLHINRSGKNLSSKDRKRLEDAKRELRVAFGRDV